MPTKVSRESSHSFHRRLHTESSKLCLDASPHSCDDVSKCSSKKAARKRLALEATIDEVTIVENDNGWASDGTSDVGGANDGETSIGGKGGEGTSTVALDRTTLALGKVADPVLLQGVGGGEVVLLAKASDFLLGLWREVGGHLDWEQVGGRVFDFVESFAAVKEQSQCDRCRGVEVVVRVELAQKF